MPTGWRRTSKNGPSRPAASWLTEFLNTISELIQPIRRHPIRTPIRISPRFKSAMGAGFIRRGTLLAAISCNSCGSAFVMPTIRSFATWSPVVTERLSIRDANDPIVCNSVKVIDLVLKRDLSQGPGWRRYNYDGYGQKEDGRAFDGTGVGRSWPILTRSEEH